MLTGCMRLKVMQRSGFRSDDSAFISICENTRGGRTIGNQRTLERSSRWVRSRILGECIQQRAAFGCLDLLGECILAATCSIRVPRSLRRVHPGSNVQHSGASIVLSCFSCRYDSPTACSRSLSNEAPRPGPSGNIVLSVPRT